MRKFIDSLKKFGKDEDGAALVEYAVLLGLLLAVALGTLTLIGGDINTIFSNVQAALATAAG